MTASSLVAVTLPKIEAATLSGCPSSAADRASRSAKWIEPDLCNEAAARPATRAAPEKPSPLPGGIKVSPNRGPSPPPFIKDLVAG